MWEATIGGRRQARPPGRHGASSRRRMGPAAGASSRPQCASERISRHREAGQRGPVRARCGLLRAIKLVHTVAWFSIESCMTYVLWAGFNGRSDRRAAIAAAVVAGETLVFAANGFRCPLTEVAERAGADRGAVTDIYLPRWFARNLPAIHVPLIALAVYLHARQSQRTHDNARAAASPVGLSAH